MRLAPPKSLAFALCLMVFAQANLYATSLGSYYDFSNQFAKPESDALRFGVVDLGIPNCIPFKITNSGYVLYADDNTYDHVVWGVWHLGSSILLQPYASGDVVQVNDISENGTVIGTESGTTIQIATWAPGATTPTLTSTPASGQAMALNDNDNWTYGVDSNSYYNGFKDQTELSTITVSGGSLSGTQIIPRRVNNQGDLLSQRYINSLSDGNYNTHWYMNTTSLGFLPTDISNEIGGVTYVTGAPNDSTHQNLFIWDSATGSAHEVAATPNGGNSSYINARTATVSGLTVPAIQLVFYQSLYEMDPATGTFNSPHMLTTLSGLGVAHVSNSLIHVINDNGVVVVETGSGNAALLVPTELAVDTNRDGILVLANENTSGQDASGNPVDVTTQAKPFRFWLDNDEDDGTGFTNGMEVVPPGYPDSQSDQIKMVRNLEDYTRLWIYMKGLNQGIHDGSIKVGLKWKTVESGAPSIKLHKATDSDGGLEYQTSLTAANAQINNSMGIGLAIGDASTGNTVVAPTSSAADFVFPTSVWTNLTNTAPKSYFIFDGVAKGKGQLEIVFLKSDGTTKIGEGGSVWLDLKDVKEMYQRVKAIPETIAAPYSSGGTDPSPVHMTVTDDSGSFTYSKDPNETKDYFVFVHGWNMSYAGSTNYSETMFKRLWWRGYKGRFAAFRWPTYSSSFPVFDPYGSAAIEASLARYNDSEYIAWESGSALAQYVNSLPSGYTRHVASHSMGGIVVASAFQQSTPMNCAYYTALHAAVPAYCYDTTTSALEDAYTTAGYVTPDHDSDPATTAMAYRGRVTSVGSANVTSFYDANDSALQSWESNNHLTKPQPLYAYLSGYYFYAPSSPNGQKLGLQFILVVGRFMTDKYESMAYADKSLTKTLGADGRTAGLIGSGVNMNANYGFDTEHSAEFGRALPQVQTYYYDLLSHMGLSENYLDSTHPAISP